MMEHCTWMYPVLNIYLRNCLGIVEVCAIFRFKEQFKQLFTISRFWGNGRRQHTYPIISLAGTANKGLTIPHTRCTHTTCCPRCSCPELGTFVDQDNQLSAWKSETRNSQGANSSHGQNQEEEFLRPIRYLPQAEVCDVVGFWVFFQLKFQFTSRSQKRVPHMDQAAEIRELCHVFGSPQGPWERQLLKNVCWHWLYQLIPQKNEILD